MSWFQVAYISARSVKLGVRENHLLKKGVCKHSGVWFVWRQLTSLKPLLIKESFLDKKKEEAGLLMEPIYRSLLVVETRGVEVSILKTHSDVNKSIYQPRYISIESNFNSGEMPQYLY